MSEPVNRKEGSSGEANQMTTIKLRSDVRVLTDPEGGVLLNLATGKYYSVTTVGARICDRLVFGDNFAQIIEFLSEAFEAPEFEIRRDVQAFLGSLKTNRLVEAFDE